MYFLATLAQENTANGALSALLLKAHTYCDCTSHLHVSDDAATARMVHQGHDVRVQAASVEHDDRHVVAGDLLVAPDVHGHGRVGVGVLLQPVPEQLAVRGHDQVPDGQFHRGG